MSAHILHVKSAGLCRGPNSERVTIDRLEEPEPRVDGHRHYPMLGGRGADHGTTLIIVVVLREERTSLHLLSCGR